MGLFRAKTTRTTPGATGLEPAQHRSTLLIMPVVTVEAIVF